MYSYTYPRPALTVDCVLFGWDIEKEQIKVLLIERAHNPYEGFWAFPGGFVDMDETTDLAAARELEEETGVTNVYMEQLYTFSGVNRDPRERVVSVAYFALVKPHQHQVVAASDAKRAQWIALGEIEKLAFDHQLILDTAVARLRSKVRYQPIGFELLPSKFSLSQLQSLYEAILGIRIDKRNFRRKVLKSNVLTALNEYQQDVTHRAARLYQFDQARYKELTEKGYVFDL
ncbi:MAG: NUDIX hydrolase [Cytophagales bacterium]|nr:MAG: NUDIX hydrolase [Cytophagales bacterium]